ncbi:MAG: YafY family protein [Burkholderiales bacterium]|nr:YafY family protein [Burkholderiales bacterium]
MDRTERLYRIDALLNEQGSVTLNTFLARLEVSRATLMRDLGYLRDRLHAPIAWDKDAEAYRLDRSLDPQGRYALPGLWFNPSEIHALLAMQQLLHDIEPGLLAPHLKPLTRRLQGLLEKGRYPADEVARRVRLTPMGRRRSTGAHFTTVAQALLTRQRLAITHHSRHTDETLERVLSPQRLVYYRDNWYLDAWCHTREDLRSFSVDAIAHARPLDEAAQDAQPLALADRFDAGYGIFSSATAMRWARLRFNAYKARWVSQEQWHPRQRASLCDDGSMLLEVPYHDPRELAMDVLKHGGDCEVIEPPELRALVVAQARAILDRHAD